MSLKVTIEGQGSFEVAKECVKKVVYKTDIPLDSNARATDNGASIKIWGKLLFSLGGEEQDSTLNLAQWSLVPSESPDSYRNVKVDVVSASQIVRQITLPNAFVVEYDVVVNILLFRPNRC